MGLFYLIPEHNVCILKICTVFNNSNYILYLYICLCYTIYVFLIILTLSQESLRNPRIVRVGNRQGYRQRVSVESSKGVRGIVKGCPRNRQRVSAESSKGVRGFVEGHQHSHNHQRQPQNRTVFLE